MEILPATRVDEAALRAFYAGSFPEREAFLSAHWRWLYRVGRYPGIEPLVLAEGGRVLGHAGAIPVELVRAGKRATAIWFVDFKIAPELQGKGLGKELTEAWMKMCPDRVTFCNEHSLRVFRKLGWRVDRSGAVCTAPLSLPSRLNPYLRPLDPAFRALARAALSGRDKLEVSPLPGDPAELAWLDDGTLDVEPRVVRDAEWIRWRLLDSPLRAQYSLARLGAMNAIVRVFESAGRRRAHLVHAGHGTPTAQGKLARAFVRWALDQDADAAWLATNDPSMIAQARTGPLLPHETRFAWHSDDGAFVDSVGRKLETQGLDSDHDLMFPC